MMPIINCLSIYKNISLGFIKNLNFYLEILKISLQIYYYSFYVKSWVFYGRIIFRTNLFILTAMQNGLNRFLEFLTSIIKFNTGKYDIFY